MAVYVSSHKDLQGIVFGCPVKNGVVEVPDEHVEKIAPLLEQFYGCKPKKGKK